jgi:hypothetical protein
VVSGSHAVDNSSIGMAGQIALAGLAGRFFGGSIE